MRQGSGRTMRGDRAWDITPDEVPRLRAPTFSLAQVSQATGAPVSTLRNWLDRDFFRFDQDSNRDSGKHRRFSKVDVLKIFIAYQLIRQSISAYSAAECSEIITKHFIDHIILEKDADMLPNFFIVDIAEMKIDEAVNIEEYFLNSRRTCFLVVSAKTLRSFIETAGNLPSV